MAIPARPGAYLILVEPDLPFGQRKRLLHLPAGPRHPPEVLKRHGGGTEDEVIGDLLGLADAATREQEVRHALRRIAPRHRHARPVIPPWALTTLPRRETLPRL